MADFPGGVYSPRTKENKPGVAYEPAKTTIGFAEDINKLDDEVVAIETFLSPKKLTLRPEVNIDEVKKNFPVRIFLILINLIIYPDTIFLPFY